MKDSAGDPRDHPRRPPSEVEWEDLLVRLELMPRVLKVTMERFTPLATVAGRIMEDLAARETRAGRFLEAANGTVPIRAAVDDAQIIAVESDAMDRFVRSRARNFAIVQRRGIDVWEWEAPLDDAGSATVYQMIAHLVDADVAALADLRGAAAGPDVC